MAFAEVWTIDGNDPCIWKIPFRARWQGVEGEFGELRPAVPLLKIQEQSIMEILTQHANYIGDGCWSILRKNLEGVATLVADDKDITLEEVERLYYWNRLREARDTAFAFHPKNKGFNDFVDFAHSFGIGECREQVHYWFELMVRAMLERLINREQPIDFGFIKLHCCPYRVNWKDVLMSRFPTLGRVLVRTQGQERFDAADRALFLDEMASLDLLAMGSRGNCYKSIEVEYSLSWWKRTALAERERLNKLGDVGYAKYTTSSVRYSLKRMLEIYSSYCSQVALFSAAHVEGERAGDYRLIPHKPKAFLAQKNRIHWPLPSVVDNKVPEFKPASDAEYLRLAYEVVPPLSAFQPQPKNVRNLESRPDGSKRAWREKR
jgi:hypothetical protein